MPAPLSYALLLSAIAILGVFAGVRLSLVHSIARPIVAFSGGVLIGVALFWVLPDIALFFGWPGAIAWVAAGAVAVWITDRYIHPVCPSCAHTHDHDQCHTRLHGLAGPLLAVASVHSFFDGWVLAASAQDSTAILAAGVLIGLAAHKLPEGIALGVIVRASMRESWAALWSCLAVEALTVVGAGAELAIAPSIGTAWAHALLAVAAGSFIYLGYHAVHSEYKRGGAAPAFMPALTGVAGSSVVRLVGGRFFGV